MGTSSGKSATTSDFTDSGYQPAGIYGWRKQCLYAVILFLLIIVVLNVAITVWILRVLNFNIEGLHFGNVKVLNDGVHINGKVGIAKTLYASKIAALDNNRLNIESKKDFLLTAQNNENTSSNILHLSKYKLEATCDSFEVLDPSGKTRFKVTDKEVTYGVGDVTFHGKTVFDASIQTPSIRGPSRGTLRLESTSSSLLLSAMERMLIEAPEGDIRMKTSQDIIFKAQQQISINATKIYMKNLDISSPNSSGKLYDDVYQVCICQNGRLFIAPSVGKCVTENDTCL